MKKMSFFDKVKNMFTEEIEDDEVKVEKIESDAKKIKAESSNKTESVDQRLNAFGGLNTEVKDVESVKKPVFFTDKDFDDLLSKPKKEESNDLYRENNKNTYSGNYQSEKEKEEKKIFKPTPIISPVYGILDKNYHKEDIVSKNEISKDIPTDGLSVDSVRNKAYGTLEDELESTLFGQNSILFNDKVKEEQEETDFFEELEKETQPDILEELKKEENTTIEELDEITMDIEKELDSLLNKKEKKENTKKEQEETLKEDDLFELIDSMYEGEDK